MSTEVHLWHYVIPAPPNYIRQHHPTRTPLYSLTSAKADL